MKSYIQGLITVAVFIFALMVLIGATGNSGGKYAISTTSIGSIIYVTILDTETGIIYKKKRVSYSSYTFVNTTNSKP